MRNTQAMLSEPRTILVTGGTSGIGLELVRLLHGLGHRLVVVARSPQRLQRLQAELPTVDAHACDLAGRAAVERMWEQVGQRHPGLSIVVNNAAVQSTARFVDEDFDLERIGYETAVNFLAPAWLSALAIGMFQADNRASAIVNISSGLAYHPKRDAAVYCATKAALHSLSQGLRYQLEGTRTRVIEAILPVVDTPMTAGRGRGKISARQAAAGIVQGMARGRAQVHVGKARWLPLLERLSPAIPRAILRHG